MQINIFNTGDVVEINFLLDSQNRKIHKDMNYLGGFQSKRRLNELNETKGIEG